MTKEKITKVRLGDKLDESLTDWDRVDALTEEKLERAIDEDPDTMRLEDMDLSSAVLYRPDESKERVTIRLDRDVIDWFRSQGRGYQTRINAVLRAFYEQRRKTG